jgi:hypothetical protein
LPIHSNLGGMIDHGDPLQHVDDSLACVLAYEKVDKCIQSASTADHFDTCSKMIDAFEVLFQDEFSVRDYVRKLKKLMEVYREHPAPRKPI